MGFFCLTLISPILCNASESNITATNSQIQPLISSTEKLPATAQVSAQQPESLVEILFDPKDYATSTNDDQGFWSNRAHKFYGKSVLEWTDTDFFVLEKKLKEQLIIIKKEAESSLSRKNYKTLEDDSDYRYHRNTLQKAIDSIPKNKVFIALAKKEAEETEAKENAVKQQREAVRIKHESERKQESDDREATRKTEADASQAKREQERKEYAERERISNLKFWFFAILAGLGAAWYWNKFMRLRCPTCRTTSPELEEEEELDSWLGTKSVSESLGNGKSRTRHVSATFAKVNRTYKCRTCGNKWDVVSKEEK